LQNRKDKWIQTKEDKEEGRFQHNRSYIALSVWRYCRSNHALQEEEVDRLEKGVGRG
jgi:hypothetical protein